MTKIILPPATIGIIGGGQLGRMMAISARQMGYKIAVLEPGEDSPLAQISDIEISAAYDDEAALADLLAICDVVTYEFENIPYAAVQAVENVGYIPQGHRPLMIAQNRLREKDAINEAGFNTAPYADVSTEEKFRTAISEIGYPAVLKTVSGGYDGKGQWSLKSDEDLPQALAVVKEHHCILEGFVPFDKEVSVIVARSTTGETHAFPVVENVHFNSILHTSTLPANVDAVLAAKAQDLAENLIERLDLVGTLAIEMFVVGSELLVNELAPRPHNSGHLTIDCCNVSQFEQHIRAVCGLPLIESEILQPATMVNLLGQHVDYAMEMWQTSAYADGYLHMYGKEENKRDRKVGHLTFLEKDATALKAKVAAFLTNFPK
ncbi:MAG: 5-(carboxyamino)imidazole ribonucleotide synthase [Coriobacteriia bacterium]|nr:5-(carboxyamino)imidazole ribonucleotide synthase [Coriobacteriia bacterium]